MSEYKVPITKIREILPHPNAERLDICVVYGFHVIATKGRYKAGDAVLFIPIDSIIPEWLENKIFPPESKIKLDKRRVRQIKIRSYASQGLLIDLKDISRHIDGDVRRYDVESDLAQELGITKYEPGPPARENTGLAKKWNKPKENPLFHKYNGLDALKWYPDYFKDKEVSVTEKLHGSCARYSFLLNIPNTFFKKIVNFFRLLPKTEYCLGSNNVELTHKKSRKDRYYADDIYTKMSNKYQIESKLKLGETIFGEIIGPGVQANYHYGITEGDYEFVLYDVKIYDGEKSYFLDTEEIFRFAKERGFLVVPELYRGVYNKDIINSLTLGNSVYAPSQKVREGVVIRLLQRDGEKQSLKLISEDYLADKNNTDFH